MKAVVAAFNQEKALVGAFSVITNLRMQLFEAPPLTVTLLQTGARLTHHVTSAVLCTPSRAALLTGRYAARMGLTGEQVGLISFHVKNIWIIKYRTLLPSSSTPRPVLGCRTTRPRWRRWRPGAATGRRPWAR